SAEELPRINSRGRTLHDARAALQTLAAEMFAEERRAVAETHTPSSMVRETFDLAPPPRPGKGTKPLFASPERRRSSDSGYRDPTASRGGVSRYKEGFT